MISWGVGFYSRVGFKWRRYGISMIDGRVLRIQNQFSKCYNLDRCFGALADVVIGRLLGTSE